MNELEKLGVPVGDARGRESKDSEYHIQSVEKNGLIVCTRPGLQLVDFYRTSTVLACDCVKPKE